MTDRSTTIAYSVSIGLHLILLVTQFLSFSWLHLSRPTAPLRVVYEERAKLQQLEERQASLSRAKRDMTTPSVPTAAQSRSQQIRIPQRPLLAGGQHLSDALSSRMASLDTSAGGQTMAQLLSSRSSVVDLANLVEAAAGDPVLMSYFGMIRERIQDTANRKNWVAGSDAQGIVYVSFMLDRSGSISAVAVVTDKSSPSSMLRGAGSQIVKTAAPFPSFPPSMTEASKTIIVPLEFLLGPA